MSVEPRSPDGARRLRRIRRVSAAMAWVVSLGAVALLALFLWVWSDPMVLPGVLAAATGVAVELPLSPLAYWGSFAAAWLPLTPALAALWLARRLFRGYAEGEIFTLAAARRLGGIGRLLLLTAGAGVLARTLCVLALTWQNPPGQRQLAVSLSSNDFGLLVLGLLLTVVGWILAEAARLNDENRLFV